MLAEIVDSSEKLDVIVYLHRVRFGAQTTMMIASALSLPSHAVAVALSALLNAGLVRTTDQDGAGWWFDPNSPSAATVETLVTLYEQNQLRLLRLMTRVALDRIRSEAARLFPGEIEIRIKKATDDPEV